MYIIRMFLISWLLTVVVEELGAVIWGIRSKKGFLTVLWVNTITNPAVVGIRLLLNRTIPSADMRLAIMILVEIAVVFAEWGLFRKFIPGLKRYFLFSLTLNAASYGAGLALPVILHLSIG